ncbi:MAG: hypothetical protein LBF50_03985 [Azoarcus sp.]|nr:hypothetical protein [Azoarcus sp.]
MNGYHVTVTVTELAGREHSLKNENELILARRTHGTAHERATAILAEPGLDTLRERVLY